MTTKKLLIAGWAGMFLICALLGCIFPDQTGAVRWILTAVSLLFFLPPALLTAMFWKSKDKKGLQAICLVCLISLGASLVLMVANILSVLSSSALVGSILYYTLAVVGAPMACCGAYVSLFLWAALLFAALEGRKEAKK